MSSLMCMARLRTVASSSSRMVTHLCGYLCFVFSSCVFELEMSVPRSMIFDIESVGKFRVPRVTDDFFRTVNDDPQYQQYQQNESGSAHLMFRSHQIFLEVGCSTVVLYQVLYQVRVGYMH